MQSDEAARSSLNRSSSNNRLSAIISKKTGISPIVTGGVPPTVSADGYNTGAAPGSVEVKQEANGAESAAAVAAGSSSSLQSPPNRPSPLDRPSSISLSLPLPRVQQSESNSANGAHPDDGEEEAPSLTINHSLGAASVAHFGQFLQQPLQPLSSASSLSSSSPLPPLDPVTPVTPFTPTSSQLIPSSPTAASVDAAYKDQLDGILRRRGDSHLNLQTLDPSVSQLAVPLPLQMRQMSATAERRVAFRVDRKDGLDLVDIIPEENDEAAETKLTKDWSASMRASRGILKTANIKGTEEERRRRTARAAEREKEWVRFVQDGSTLIKYNAQGKPQKRWVYVSEDGHEIVWEKPADQWLRPKKRWDEDEDEKRDEQNKAKHATPNKTITSRSAGDIHVSSGSHASTRPPSPRPFHQHSAPALHGNDAHRATEQSSSSNTLSSRSKRRSSLPSMRILNWKINPDRTRFLADVLGVHFGPYHSAERFSRFLQRKDYQVPCILHATSPLTCSVRSSLTACLCWLCGADWLSVARIHHRVS